ncbi:hypothetical protein LDENG_00219510 [Lucifuga dentata]|nr:hypothetical protein LDENG_00219510 [Lucifuga dentata]
MLLKESFGVDAATHQAFFENVPRGVRSGDRHLWLAVCREVEGVFIHPVGGERFIYELLSIQEAMSVYGSATPQLMIAKFLDDSLGIGRSAYELVRGVDCPYSTMYIDTVHFMDTGVPSWFRNSICIFEHNMGRPLRRHFSDIQSHSS